MKVLVGLCLGLLFLPSCRNDVANESADDSSRGAIASRSARVSLTEDSEIHANDETFRPKIDLRCEKTSIKIDDSEDPTEQVSCFILRSHLSPDGKVVFTQYRGSFELENLTAFWGNDSLQLQIINLQSTPRQPSPNFVLIPNDPSPIDTLFGRLVIKSDDKDDEIIDIAVRFN